MNEKETFSSQPLNYNPGLSFCIIKVKKIVNFLVLFPLRVEHQIVDLFEKKYNIGASDFNKL